MIFDKIRKAFVPKPDNFNEDLAENKIDFQKYHVDQDLIGTPEYISPEALFLGESSPSVDLWALGCIIYLFFHGVTPFKDKNKSLIFEKIEKNEYNLNDNLSEATKDIIKKLLVKNPNERLGGGSKENIQDIHALKRHKFFENIDFENLQNQQPPINMKKVIYSKIKNNSTDSVIRLQNIPPIATQSLFTDKNFNFTKHVSDQNLTMKNIDCMKEEIEILYGRNTGEKYDVNRTPFDDESKFGNPFKIVDINEECENMCNPAYLKIKEYDKIETVILEGRVYFFYRVLINFFLHKSVHDF